MYDPEGADSGREWVELYNGGTEDAALVGGSGKGSWRIADSANHTIADPLGGVGRGSLTVPAGGYLILASDPAAFMGEYVGGYSVAKASLSLNNTGATVSLIDGSGATVSSVSYAASQGGNDNGASLQKSPDAWIQALPTPGAENASEAYVPPEKDGDSGSGPSKTPSVYAIQPPAPTVFADAGKDRTVIVGADTMFRAQAYNSDRAAFRSARFVWNFGDGISAEGTQVMHHFSYPGRYDVELYITNQNYSASSRIIVTATETAVAMKQLAGGGVSIRNLSDRDLDLSYWQVAQGATTFKLPEHSVVLKGEAINIDQSTLGFAATDAKLLYPNEKEVVQAAMPAAAASAPAPAATPASAPMVEPDPVSDVSVPFSDPASSNEPILMPVPTPAATTTDVQAHQEPAPAELSAAAVASGATIPLWTALAGLGGITGLGVAGVLAVRRRPVTREAAEEFTLED